MEVGPIALQCEPLDLKALPRNRVAECRIRKILNWNLILIYC